MIEIDLNPSMLDRRKEARRDRIIDGVRGVLLYSRKTEAD